MVKRVNKPIRLYVITIFIFVAYGLFPLVSVFPFTGGLLLVGPRFLPFNGSVLVLQDANGEIPTLLLIITICLCLFSVGAALITFFGVGEARWATLGLLTLNVAWWFYLVISAIIEAGNAPQSYELAMQLLFPPLWLVFVWWNWTRPDIKAWLDYQAKLDS